MEMAKASGSGRVRQKFKLGILRWSEWSLRERSKREELWDSVDLPTDSEHRDQAHCCRGIGSLPQNGHGGLCTFHS